MSADDPAVVALREQLEAARSKHDDYTRAHMAAVEAAQVAEKVERIAHGNRNSEGSRVQKYLAALAALGVKEPIRPMSELPPGWKPGDAKDAWPRVPTTPTQPPLSATAAESDTGTHTERESAADEGKRA